MSEIFRFGINTADGRRSHSWTLAARDSGEVQVYQHLPTDLFTATLQPDGICTLSVAVQAAGEANVTTEARWQGTEGSVAGALRLFRIVIPASELRHIDEPKPKDVVWIRPRGSGDAIEILFCLVPCAVIEPRFPSVLFLN